MSQNSLTVGPSTLPRLVARVMTENLVPYVHGAPGTAKSAVAKQFADSNKLLMIDVRLSQRTPTSLNGFGRINTESMKSEFVPFCDFPLEGDEIPEGYNGWLLFLDELPSAPPQVQAAAYQLILDKQVGSKKLHPDCMMMGAGNRKSDGALVQGMGTALQSRMVHFEMQLTAKDWLLWAAQNNVDFRVMAFVNFKPSSVESFTANHGEHTFCCGRTLHFASDLIKGVEKLTHDDLILLSGCLGTGIAAEFYGFCDIFDILPTIEEIIKDPDNGKLENSPSFKTGISSFIAEHMTQENAEPLLKYMKRISPEFQAMCARQAYRKDNTLISNPAIVQWLDDISIYF